MAALEGHVEAMRLIDAVWATGNPIVLEHGFQVDRALLPRSAPFFWSKETTEAVLAVSHSIPEDTLFNNWNLNIPACWWWFEEPLPVKTLEIPGMGDVGVRALNLGWIQGRWPGNANVFPPQPTSDGVALGISAWCDDDSRHGIGTLTPSQTWLWQENQSLRRCIDHARDMHNRLYLPGGDFADRPQIGVDAFVKATDTMSRFILAALSWLNQKIAVETQGHVERHVRKRYARTVEHEVEHVKVVNLRKMQPTKNDGTSTDRVYTCRWTVDGHFRNQACGPGYADHRLMWISPYLKGPDDKPLRPSQQKVYKVTR